ncbi:hypothetical protein IGI04_040922 [Brassica rapa subsp. trilocularis]|uniref:Uncharacterized protein n=1 Tax=Brassica rapa subsp. trilocularis TaxID=1813537 RepID=A0ABQ7KTC6_BRACM|nr:hypothetical protein IGI04_040922 [Brassica rapa subsp. trilocularis]
MVLFIIVSDKSELQSCAEMSLSASPVPQTGVSGIRHSTFESLRLCRSIFADSVIHAFILAGRVNHYKSSLKIVSIVARCSNMYKITDHSFLIRFISPTIIDEVITGAPEINL